MATTVVAAPTKRGGKGRSKKGNKHATNTRRRERKAHSNRNRQNGYTATPGKCGSSFCTKMTGCSPWK